MSQPVEGVINRLVQAHQFEGVSVEGHPQTSIRIADFVLQNAEKFLHPAVNKI